MSSDAQYAYDMGWTDTLGEVSKFCFYNDFQDDYNEQEWFETAFEAQKWAKENPGRIITRAKDGFGYIVKK